MHTIEEFIFTNINSSSMLHTESNMKKKLVVLLERNFRNVLQNKGNVKPQEQHISFPNLKPEPLVTGSDQNMDQNIGESESADCDVVEIFAQDNIVDVSRVSSDGEDDFMPVAYKIEEDEWCGLGDLHIRVINKEEIEECYENKSDLKADDGSKNKNFVEKDVKVKVEHLDSNFGCDGEFDNLDIKADVSDFEIKQNDIGENLDDNKNKTKTVSDINGDDYDPNKDSMCNTKEELTSKLMIHWSRSQALENWMGTSSGAVRQVPDWDAVGNESSSFPKDSSCDVLQQPTNKRRKRKRTLTGYREKLAKRLVSQRNYQKQKCRRAVSKTFQRSYLF